jgi:hypothetical protein
MSKTKQSARQPISTRLRFDVFKRDGFACQYCGAHPPAVVLECDHIVPVAEGGKNDIYNLVTACFGCNRGKGAVPLTTVPQSLADKAAEVAEREAQLRGYGEVMEARRQRIDDEVWRVLGVLYPGQTTVPRADYASVARFIGKLGVHKVLEAAEIALGSPAHNSRVFKYFCGVCWNMIREAEGQE